MSGKKTQKRVVVITGRSDAHIPFVERHLRVPLTVFDMRDLADGAALTFDMVGEKMLVTYEGTPLDNVCGVWFRKPQAIQRDTLPVVDTYKPYALDALEKHALLFIDAFDDAVWVSNYYGMLRASNKNLQPVVAKQLGFRVPDTIITSNADDAQAFIDKHPVCVSKSLTTTYPEIDGKQQILLTTLIDKNNRPDLTNLYLAPSIFQEAVDTAQDIRVTVVGDKVFPAYMNSGVEQEGGHTTTRDNRLGKPYITAIRDFPKGIARKCVELNHALGLNLGAIDLLLDKEGEYWFLEINPNGQWAFVEEATGLPIGKTIARLLESGVA